MTREQQAPSCVSAWVRRHAQASFREQLTQLIRKRANNDAVHIYKQAGVDRRTYAKIIGVEGYRPSRRTAVAFCLALKLKENEANTLLRPLGFALGDHDLDDLIIRYAICHGIYTLNDVNALLVAAGEQPFVNN